MWNNLNDNAASTSGGFLNDSCSSNDKSRERNARRIENIVPIMIRHLTQSYGSDLQLWGSPIHVITFVGIVKQIEQTTTKTKYEIEDETGCVTGLQWLDTDKITSELKINLNTYVRVVGHIREDNEKKYVLILKIIPLTSLNELTSHLLEVTNVMLKAEKKFLSRDECSNTTSNNPTRNGNSLGLTTDQTIVFELIQSENESQNGIERDTLKARLPKNILPELDNIINFLISEGHIYTTFTDDHFKTT
ncbi:unnamed protein product [Xylocopa violacea]|uniref:Replication protein A C-terminal domain-containing protein n=1 Tax=Xylocopa violacea TaxID=135666 RepID=A0ABP1P7P9_XYLVO